VREVLRLGFAGISKHEIARRTVSDVLNPRPGHNSMA
jgi:hypothetical protein